jgi:hypothetical protein
MEARLKSYPLSEDTRAVPLADGGLMITRGDFLAPSVALKFTPAEQDALRACLTVDDPQPEAPGLPLNGCLTS